MGKRPKQPEEETDVTWTAIPRFPAPSVKHAYLLVLAGPQFGEVFPLPSDREVELGRRDDADIQIRDDGVSRRHATIRVDGEGAIVTDLESANGTFVDGRRLPQVRIADGARIQVGGHTTLKFIWADELEALYQMRLAESALQDPLTGLYNRRHLDERLASELAASLRHGRVLSLLMIDIDHFKQVNDDRGHLAGDEALKMVAFVLRGAVRKEDVLARYGGEEFVVIARETPLDGARALGERIRRAVEKSRFAWQGGELSVTVSVGVTIAAGLAEYVPGRTEREVIEAADRALYLAKQQGRDRVVALTVGGAAEKSAP